MSNLFSKSDGQNQGSTRRKHFALALVSCVTLLLLSSVDLVGCEAVGTTQREAQGETKVDYFTDDGFGNAVATMSNPVSEHHNGVTYIAFQGLQEDPYVAAYDHTTDSWTGPYQAGVSELGKDGGKIDNHGRPALIIDKQNYIHIVFGGHGGSPDYGTNPLGNNHKGRMQHAVSENPLDISSWDVLDNIPPFGSYSQFVKMNNGDIYLFYRHGAHQSDWVYQKSVDNGITFDDPVSILKSQSRTDTEAIDSWYAWFTNGDGDEIIAIYNYHLHLLGGAHTAQRHNGYYMVMNTSDRSWHNVKGETLTMPVTKEHADDLTLVVSTGDLWSVIGTTRLDPAGNPHVSLHIGEESGPRQVNHFRWNGQEWVGGGTSGLPENAEGDFLVSASSEVSYLLSYKPGSTGKVSWWDSDDGGQSFAERRTLIEERDTRFRISAITLNTQPEARIVVAGKRSETDQRKMYLLGDSGPVQRSAMALTDPVAAPTTAPMAPVAATSAPSPAGSPTMVPVAPSTLIENVVEFVLSSFILVGDLIASIFNAII